MGSRLEVLVLSIQLNLLVIVKGSQSAFKDLGSISYLLSLLIMACQEGQHRWAPEDHRL